MTYTNILHKMTLMLVLGVTMNATASRPFSPEDDDLVVAVKSHGLRLSPMHSINPITTSHAHKKNKMPVASSYTHYTQYVDDKTEVSKDFSLVFEEVVETEPVKRKSFLQSVITFIWNPDEN